MFKEIIGKWLPFQEKEETKSVSCGNCGCGNDDSKSDKEVSKENTKSDGWID